MRYYMMNKPRGYITARRDERHKTVMDLFPEHLRDELFPVGRLDKDTEGFLLVTDDGKLSFGLMMPEHKIEKTYLFYAIGQLTEDKISALESGVDISDKDNIISAPASVSLLGNDTLGGIREYLSGKDARLNGRRSQVSVVLGTLTITEGKKHQVKRMLKAVGCRVVYLKRLSIAGVPLDKELPLGKYRELTEYEIKQLKEKTKNDVK